MKFMKKSEPAVVAKDIEQQEAEAALARFTGGVLCFDCGSVCEPKLANRRVFWCATCEIAWMGVKLVDASLLNFNPGHKVEFKITVDS